ncbi:Sodium/hydrogen exchanger 9B2 [Entophlyctis luteolus]|nr:Sodium/hydrogen exchanger 9B2 [Entophlyctis luteolus]KAJ3382984.1 Sodium/hydrogen exchanger 9B2 [Entophlyctis sp. JEL0112]
MNRDSPTTQSLENFNHALGPSVLRKVISLCILAPAAYLAFYFALSSFMLPGNLGFTLFIGYSVACVFAAVTEPAGIAPLVGMLVAGVLLRNVGAVSAVSPSLVSSEIRTVAVAIIIARAGMGLSFRALREQLGPILTLGLIPSISGALVAALFGYFVFNFSVLWSFAFGFGLASTSPAVIVPLTLTMREKGYGNADNLASTFLGALPLDIMVGVVGNSVFLGIIFQATGSAMVYAHAPIELAAGVIGSLVLSAIVFGASRLPLNSPQEQNVMFTFFVVVSITVALGTKLVGYTGAGAMANMMMWTSVQNCFDEACTARFGERLKTIWLLVEPCFFSVIGMTLSFSLVAPHTVGLAFAIVIAVECIRSLVTFSAMKMTGKPVNEALFVAGKWSAKASIQAALATAALDAAKAAGSDPAQIQTGTTILITYLFAILLMAPFAAVWVSILMKRLLKSDAEHLRCFLPKGVTSLDSEAVKTFLQSV